jgi:hypothetical protein
MDLEHGVTYRFPLYIHCGMEWLGQFNGTEWKLVIDSERPNPDTGGGEGVPAHWPEAQQTIFGDITLIDEDTIEYSIGDGEVIATYFPTDLPRPGCD